MDRDELVVSVSVGLVIVSMILGWGYFWNTYTCNSKWRHSGMKSEFSVINGCMLEVTPGKWIPADRYRSID